MRSAAAFPSRVDIESIAPGLMRLVVDGSEWGSAMEIVGGGWFVIQRGRKRNRKPISSSALRDRVARMAYEERKR